MINLRGSLPGAGARGAAPSIRRTNIAFSSSVLAKSFPTYDPCIAPLKASHRACGICRKDSSGCFTSTATGLDKNGGLE